MTIMREISQSAVDLWGLEPQMLMVAEESVELTHAILKWRRAWKKYNSQGVPTTREQDIKSKAISRALERAIENVKLEAMQVFFMIDQLHVMLPGDYESILEIVLDECAQRLRNRGVDI